MNEKIIVKQEATGSCEPTTRCGRFSGKTADKDNHTTRCRMSRTEVECPLRSKLCTLRKQKEHLANENPDGKIIVIGEAHPFCNKPGGVDCHV